jgi:hypothetical protein
VLCVSFDGRRHERLNYSIGPGRMIEPWKLKMNIRLFSASAAASLGLAVSNGAHAWTVVRATYAAPVIVYAPPPRPVYYAVPVPPAYVVPVVQTAPVAVMVPAPVPAGYVQPPKPVPMVASYAPTPVVNVSYAQPVATVPVTGNR